MTENMPAFFPDFGVNAVHGAASAKVLFDRVTREVLDGLVLDEEASITLAASALPALARGEAVTVNGVAYTVREVQLIDDGLVKRVTLRKV
jgi:hypothetical protein